MAQKPRDEERIRKVTEAIKEDGLDALLCTLPSNVLMLSGYWPIIGNAIALVSREGNVGVAVPEDEEQAARQGWPNEVRTFQSGSLDELDNTLDAVQRPLRELKQTLRLRGAKKIGFEGGPSFDPNGYASGFEYGYAIAGLLGKVFDSSEAVSTSDRLARLRATLTMRELEALRCACGIAQQAFLSTAPAISPGMREFEIAARFKQKLITGAPENERCDGYAYCMSGENSARAYAAFQHSGWRAIAPGDFVLLHCNSYCGGYWTDITRTFCAGHPDPEKSAIIEAVMNARLAAIAAVRPGVEASTVDRAARQELTSRGFGKGFKHPTGHGVGFAAINHNALPRIHPLSREKLEVGMVFNIEPAVYISKLGGMRHCDMIAVTENGAEVLTPF